MTNELCTRVCALDKKNNPVCFDREVLLMVSKAKGYVTMKHSDALDWLCKTYNVKGEYRQYHLAQAILKDDKLMTELMKDHDQHDFIVNELQESFIKQGPQEDDPYSWLSNTDIEDVLVQFQRKRKDFCYLGMATYDFDVYMLDKFINTMDENPDKRFFGIVQNTCYVRDSGQHWLSIIIDMKNKKIIYVDSTGYNPKLKIRNGQINPMYTFVKSVQLKYFIKNDTKLQEIELMKSSGNIFFDKKQIIIKQQHVFDVYDGYFVISRKRQQRKGGQCGMYALYNMIMYATNHSIEFLANDITDEQMKDLRKELFLNYALAV